LPLIKQNFRLRQSSFGLLNSRTPRTDHLASNHPNCPP
jgi:hypothetical protein